MLLSIFCVAAALLLLGVTIFICQSVEKLYPSGGVELFPDGTMIPLPEPTAAQQTVIMTLDIAQVVFCVLFPMAGVIASVVLFYRIKLRKPIGVLRDGITRIQNNDLDFTLPVLSTDEMGQLCAAFEGMRGELLKTNRLLWQQAEERKRLNAAFSHDLRNPITVLKGTVKLLRQGVRDDQTINRLEGYTLRIEQYVEAMNSVQRLEQLSVHPTTIVLSVLQNELQETIRLLAGTKKTSLSVPSAGQVVLDHGIFLTVAENLIGNATRFAKSKLSIEVVLEKGHLLLKISDDGPGYPSALIQNGPKPFETASSNSSHFGMGLYSSQTLCLKHGGTLSLANRKDHGATATASFQINRNP